jgi:hypothetical protein
MMKNGNNIARQKVMILMVYFEFVNEKPFIFR